MAQHTTTIPLTGPINLLVKFGSGSIGIDTQDDLTDARVELSAQDPGSDAVERCTVELRGPTLVVEGPHAHGMASLLGAGRRRDSVDARVVVPTGTAMKLLVGSAPVTMTGTSGGTELTSGSGAVSIARVDGALNLRIGSADATVGPVTGPVEVKAGSGEITLGDLGDTAEVITGSGNLIIESVAAALRAKAGSGDVTVRRLYADVDVLTGSGDVRIGLPAGVSAYLDTRTGSGRLRTDLPIEDEPAAATREIGVRTRSGSGDVDVFRAPAGTSVV